MKTCPYPYPGGDVDAIGYLALPDVPGKRPGVLVAHEGPGLDEHAKLRARMLAELGYVALAVDLLGGGEVITTHQQVLERIGALRSDRALIRARMRSGLDALRGIDTVDDSRIAAIGYCFGGMAVLELARSGAAVCGVTAFHGLLDTDMPAGPGAITASILICTGSDDHLVPPEQVAAFEREMANAGADWQVSVYGGARHAFTNKIEAKKLEALGFGYDEKADRRSWNAMRAFLEELF